MHVYFISWEAQIIKILPIPCKNYYQERNYSSSFLVCQNHDNFWPLSPKGLKPAAVTQLHVRSWLLRWKPWGRVNNDCHPETMHREPWATHSLFIPPPPQEPPACLLLGGSSFVAENKIIITNRAGKGSLEGEWTASTALKIHAWREPILSSRLNQGAADPLYID